MEPRPILFCSHVVDWGGAETVLADLFAGIDREKFAPHLLCPGDGPLPQRARQLEVAVHHLAIGGDGRLRKARSVPGAARQLRRIAAATGARLIYANTMIAGYAGLRAQRADLRCLWHVHVVTGSRIARFAGRRVAGLVTPSRLAAAALRRADADVVENGVPDAFFAATGSGLRAELGLEDDALLVGIVGRIDPRKGHEVLLRACAESNAPGFHVAIVGDEAFAATEARVRGQAGRLESLATMLGIAPRVHFLGHRDDMPAVLAGLDVIAVPSIIAESAPRTIAEAQAAARPIVASRIGGIPEMVRDGITGRLCAPGDPGALRQALEPLLGDPTERETLGRAAREHARTHYSMAVFIRRIEAICDRVLGRPGGPLPGPPDGQRGCD